MLENIVPYWDVVYPILIIIGFVIAGKIVDFVIRKIIRKFTDRTQTDLDDYIINAIHNPIFLYIILVGVFTAIPMFTLLSEYAEMISMGATIIYTLFAAFIVVRVINAFLTWYASQTGLGKVDDQFLSVARKVIYIVVFLVAVVAMLGQLGIEITTLIATLGVGGLAIALALQGTLSNFFAGAYMILDKPIRVGDYIELEGGDKGYVQDIGWRSTKIKMLGDKVVIIPNSKIAESKLINYDQPTRAMSVIISCGVGYNENLEKVEKVTIKVGKNIQKTVDGAVKDFEPFIRYNEFGDSNINFSVILRAKNYVAQYLMKHEFIKQLKKAYDKEGIEISWPVTKVYMAKKKVD